MGVYKYICCINVQEKPVGLLEAPQSNIHPLRRLQTVEVKASESSMKVSEGVYIYIYICMHGWIHFEAEVKYFSTWWTIKHTVLSIFMNALLKPMLNWFVFIARPFELQKRVAVHRWPWSGEYLVFWLLGDHLRESSYKQVWKKT